MQMSIEGWNNGNVWKVDEQDGTIRIEPKNSNAPEEFFLELRGPNQFAIYSVRLSKYLRAEQSGLFRVDASELPTQMKDFLFEF